MKRKKGTQGKHPNEVNQLAVKPKSAVGDKLKVKVSQVKSKTTKPKVSFQRKLK